MGTFIHLLLMTLILAQPASAEEIVPKKLTLNECVALALQHNFDARIERLSLDVARYQLSGSYGAYEPSFNLNAGENFLTQPGSFDPKKTGLDYPYELTQDTVGIGVTGTLPSGLRYGLQAESSQISARTDFSLQARSVIDFPPFGIRSTNQYVSGAGLTLAQPLLKDFWIDASRQRIWVNQKNVKMSESGLLWQMMNLVKAVDQAYYELSFAHEKVRVVELGLELARQLLKETSTRVRVGGLPILSEKEVASHVETVQTDLYSAQYQLHEQENALKKLMVDDYGSWADVRIDPETKLIALPETFDRQESWRAAVEKRPDLAQLRLEVEKLGIVVRYRFNQLFPTLDIVGGYGVLGADHTIGGSLAELRDQTNPQYSYGLRLSIPLGGNRTARNSYRASRAEKEEAVLRLKKMQQDVLVQVDDAVELMRSTYKRTASTHEARLYAEEALKAEQIKSANGLSTPFFLLQYQQKLTNARLNETRAVTDYNKALAQLNLSEGTTLEKHHIGMEGK